MTQLVAQISSTFYAQNSEQATMYKNWKRHHPLCTTKICNPKNKNEKQQQQQRPTKVPSLYILLSLASFLAQAE
jgi:hypothetical protein